MPDVTGEPFNHSREAAALSPAGVAGSSVLSWLHIGDLYLAEADAENHQDLQRIVALAGGLPTGSLDFALLPGDNADDGTPEQFRLVRDAVAPLRLPLHVLPGEHDFKPRSLDAFYGVLGARRLPYSITAKGHRCLFLDVVSAGTGGPDFRLGKDQLAWAERELDAAEAAGEGAVVFMHTYPADLREGADRLGALLGHPDVLCVDMGHTHYNEIANDGGTIFMATRSTGQIEEGPPGFSVAAVDGDCVSWRFKPLSRAWPLVLVTRPADRRLVVDAGQIVSGPFLARAKVVGDAMIEAVEVQVDGGAWAPMAPASGEPAVWEARCDTPGNVVRVRARDAAGRGGRTRTSPSPRATAGRRRGAPRTGATGTASAPGRNGASWTLSSARTATGGSGERRRDAG